MRNVINIDRAKERSRNKEFIKRNKIGSYNLTSKDIERQKYRQSKRKAIMHRKRVHKKVALLLFSAVILLLTVNRFDNSRYVRFLEKNPYSQSSKVKIKELRKDLPNLEKQLGIHEVQYNWDKKLEYNNKPKVLVFHHTASKELTADQINSMHIKKDWAGIGYHFYIRKDGTIYRGRPENAIGAHIKGQNTDSLGICIEGNLEEEEPTEQEIDALEKLSTYLIVKYNIYKVQGHGDTYKTLCPGKNFPIEDVKEEITKELENDKIHENK